MRSAGRCELALARLTCTGGCPDPYRIAKPRRGRILRHFTRATSFSIDSPLTANPMHDLVRWSVAVTLVLLVPIIPFLSFGDSLEAQVEPLVRCLAHAGGNGGDRRRVVGQRHPAADPVELRQHPGRARLGFLARPWSSGSV